MDATLLYTTWPELESAKKAARELLDARLIACANILPPTTSIYRWEGKLEESTEVVMLLKVSANTAPKTLDRLLSIHPYDTPCILNLPIEGGAPEFLKWVAGETE